MDLALIIWNLIITGAVVALPFLIRGMVDHRFAKRLEDHRHSLNLQTEAAKDRFQRELREYELYITRKHVAYGELFQLAMKADSAVAALSGFQRTLSMEDFSESDFISLLDGRGYPDRMKERLVGRWRDDPNTARKEFWEYDSHMRINKAYHAIQEAKKHRWLNAIYVSDETAALTDQVLKELWACVALHETAIGGIDDKSVLEKFTKHDQNLRCLRDRLLAAMKQDVRGETPTNSMAHAG